MIPHQPPTRILPTVFYYGALVVTIVVKCYMYSGSYDLQTEYSGGTFHKADCLYPPLISSRIFCSVYYLVHIQCEFQLLFMVL